MRRKRQTTTTTKPLARRVARSGRTQVQQYPLLQTVCSLHTIGVGPEKILLAAANTPALRRSRLIERAAWLLHADSRGGVGDCPDPNPKGHGWG